MIKLLRVFTLVAALMAFAIHPAKAQFGTEAADGKEISKEDAVKKYPPPKGGYPTGELTAAGGIVKSPYSPFHSFKTHIYGKNNKPMSIQRGALMLDTFTNHVFVNP